MDQDQGKNLTRRSFVLAGAGLVGGLLLEGCTSEFTTIREGQVKVTPLKKPPQQKITYSSIIFPEEFGGPLTTKQLKDFAKLIEKERPSTGSNFALVPGVDSNRVSVMSKRNGVTTIYALSQESAGQAAGGSIYYGGVPFRNDKNYVGRPSGNQVGVSNPGDVSVAEDVIAPRLGGVPVTEEVRRLRQYAEQADLLLELVEKKLVDPDGYILPLDRIARAFPHDIEKQKDIEDLRELLEKDNLQILAGAPEVYVERPGRAAEPALVEATFAQTGTGGVYWGLTPKGLEYGQAQNQTIGEIFEDAARTNDNTLTKDAARDRMLVQQAAKKAVGDEPKPETAEPGERIYWAMQFIAAGDEKFQGHYMHPGTDKVDVKKVRDAHQGRAVIPRFPEDYADKKWPVAEWDKELEKLLTEQCKPEAPPPNWPKGKPYASACQGTQLRRGYRNPAATPR